MKGRAFAIEECSVYDGPGIRTTVFLKGCPLRCNWCHNPEGQDPAQRILRNDNGCLGCGACERYAERTAEGLTYTEESRMHCPRHLLRVSGEDYEPDALCEKLLKNKGLLAGVTFSGGEPLMQADFLTDCLAILEGKLHRAVQTCGYASRECFERVLSLTDYVLFDLKLADEEEHRRHTGVSNRPILANFDLLTEHVSPERFTVRVPLIPTVTDTEDNLGAIAAILRAHGVTRVELLPYNTFAGGKYHLVGREYRPLFDGTVTPNPRTALFASHGIEASVL